MALHNRPMRLQYPFGMSAIDSAYNGTDGGPCPRKCRPGLARQLRGLVKATAPTTSISATSPRTFTRAERCTRAFVRDDAIEFCNVRKQDAAENAVDLFRPHHGQLLRHLRDNTSAVSQSCVSGMCHSIPPRFESDVLSGGYRRWLGRQDSNLGMAESKSTALPLGYAPTRRTIAAAPAPINARSKA